MDLLCQGGLIVVGIILVAHHKHLQLGLALLAGADDTAVIDLGHGPVALLNKGGIHQVAADLIHPLQPLAVVNIALFVNEAHIAGVQPNLAVRVLHQHFCGLLRVVVIALH